MADKENSPPGTEPLKKRKRLSLSRKGRFKKIVADDELEEAAKGVVPKNTKRRDIWAIKNFEDWAKNRREREPSDPVPEDLLKCTDPEVINTWLSRFVLETRQKNGQPYPPRSLHGLLCGIQRAFRENEVSLNFLEKKDIRFATLHKTLDTLCCDLHSKGVGASVKSTEVISYEDEDVLWKLLLCSMWCI